MGGGHVEMNMCAGVTLKPDRAANKQANAQTEDLNINILLIIIL